MNLRKTIDEILEELAPDLPHGAAAEEAAARIRLALADDLPEPAAHDVAFHMTDWSADAAFVVALVLFPRRFSHEEVRWGVHQFLIHAPNHIAAAAKLAGHPVRDIFEVGARDGATP